MRILIVEDEVQNTGGYGTPDYGTHLAYGGG